MLIVMYLPSEVIFALFVAVWENAFVGIVFLQALLEVF